MRALQWLAQREHSPAELREKLLRAARAPRQRVFSEGQPADAGAPDAGQELPSPDEEVDALIQWLATHGHLSVQRFVESRVHARQSRFGQQRITRELQQHGLALGADEQAALQATEFERARAVWLKKFGEPAADAAGRVKQMRFLAGRGFSHEVIRRLILRRTGEPDIGDVDPSGDTTS